MARRGSDSGRYAIIWLATAYTCFIGLAPVCVVILVASENPQTQLIVVSSALAVVGLFVIYKFTRWQSPVNHLSYWLFAHERNNLTDIYRAARRRKKAKEEYGNNPPPSLESIRDAAEHGGAWVPHSNVERHHPRRSG